MLKKVTIGVRNDGVLGTQVFVCEDVLELPDRLIMTDIQAVHGLHYATKSLDKDRRGVVNTGNAVWWTVENAVPEDVPAQNPEKAGVLGGREDRDEG